jgi:Zn-dependent metalloprotease
MTRLAISIGALLTGLVACGTTAAQSFTNNRGELGTFRANAAVRDLDAATLLQGLRTELRADGSEALKLRKSSRDVARGVSHHRMTQTIDGLEVIGGEMILHVDDATSQVLSIDTQFLSGTGLPRTPAIAASKAITVALRTLKAVNAERTNEPRLAFARAPDGKGHLVWVARVRYTDTEGTEQLDDVVADAVNGRLVDRVPRRHHALFRKVNHGRTGELLISEGGTTSDSSAANCYQFSGDTYRYLWNALGRDSFTGRGSTMQCYVHANVDNGYYEEGAVYLSDGDGFYYGNMSNARDVVAHEWGHGVVEFEANLHNGEAGMMNEMMADVLGAAVEASITGVTANTWKVAEDAATPGIPDDALRYMNDPALDGFSPDFYPDLRENHGAHFGAGIGDLAFYLLANGGTHPRGKTTLVVQGIGIDPAMKIYYLALRDYLLGNDDYAAGRDKMARVAQEQYGEGSLEHLSVCDAWTAVGVPNTGTYCP